MFDTKAMRFPSGEKLGDEQDPILAIRATVRLRSSPGVCATTFRELDEARFDENRKIAHKNPRRCRRCLRTGFEVIMESGLSVFWRVDEMLFFLGPDILTDPV